MSAAACAGSATDKSVRVPVLCSDDSQCFHRFYYCRYRINGNYRHCTPEVTQLKIHPVTTIDHEEERGRYGN
jgi:hypothetical protein